MVLYAYCPNKHTAVATSVFTKLLFHYYTPRLSLDWNIHGLDAIERYHTVGMKSMRDLRRISYTRLGLQKGGCLSGRGEGGCMTRWLYTLHGRSGGRCIGDDTSGRFFLSRFLFCLLEIGVLVK